MKVLQVVNQLPRTLNGELANPSPDFTEPKQTLRDERMVLLCGQAVYYAIVKRHRPILTAGSRRETEAAAIPADITDLLEDGVPVYVVLEDLADRGLGDLPLLKGVQPVSRMEIIDLCEEVDQICSI